MIIHADSCKIPLAEKSVHCVVTSPPYWGLRDYGYDGQLGQENTPEAYIGALMVVMNEVWRVLRDDGVLWLNLGDSYIQRGCPALKIKDLAMIPHRVAISMQERGWYVRQDNVWMKPNCMPESVRDRTTRQHEYVFQMTKQKKYFYDSDATRVSSLNGTVRRSVEPRRTQPNTGKDKQSGHGRRYKGFNERWKQSGGENGSNGQALRSVWTIATQPYSGAHFAVMPEELVKHCILAGCPAGGVVLDPFAGTGTVVKVAREMGRMGVGLELNREYIALAKDRAGVDFQSVLV